MEFHERLRMLRKKAGLTQAELAYKLDYGYTAISNYESGRNQPSISDLIRLSDEFGVTIDYLVGRDGFQLRRPTNVKSLKFGQYGKLVGKIVVRVIIKNERNKYKNEN